MEILVFLRESVPKSPEAQRGFQKPRGQPVGPEGWSGGRSEARKRRTEAGAEARGPDGLPEGFLKSPTG